MHEGEEEAEDEEKDEDEDEGEPGEGEEDDVGDARQADTDDKEGDDDDAIRTTTIGRRMRQRKGPMCRLQPNLERYDVPRSSYTTINPSTSSARTEYIAPNCFRMPVT